MHRLSLLIGFLTTTFMSSAQTMTVITTLINGQKDTLKFGFVQNATQVEDDFLNLRAECKL